MPNSIAIWQAFRDDYSSSVIFGKTPVDEALDQGGRQGHRARRRSPDRRRRCHDVSRPRPSTRPDRPVAADGRRRLLGRQPLGIVFAAPYAVFLAAVFAYPLGLAVWISFHDYFFAAPGAQVDRPFVGLENYTTVLADPAVRRSFLNVG
ncbi:MAG: hypothetical protein WKF76_06130 [Nocardioidaceae bacterium]